MVKVVFLSTFLAHLTCLFSLFFRWRILELNKVRSLLFFKSWFFVAFVCHLRLVPKDFRGATAVCSFEASLFARRGYFVVSCDLKQFFSSIRLRYKLNVKWKPCQSFPFHHICSNLLQFAPIDHFNSTKVHSAFEITCLKWRNMLCSVHLSFSLTSSRVKFDSKFVLQAREYY